MANELVSQLKSDKVIAQFEATAGKQAKAFAGEVAISILGNPALEKASLASVITEATKASALGLSLLPSVGEAYLVPYKGNAQFQLGYKGLIQLAMRSGQMKSFGVVEVYAGENPKWNKFDQELETSGEETGEVVGYYAWFTLTNGFKKADYWTKAKVEAHRDRFSKAANNRNSPWSTDFDAMAKKTVLKSILQYAPKSAEMSRALADDTEAEFEQAKDVTPIEQSDTTLLGDIEDAQSEVFDTYASDNTDAFNDFMKGNN